MGKTVQLCDLARPFLRWAGSKRQLIPYLRELWDSKCLRYVEPFAGSSVLFFALKPTTALLADKNRELIEAYEVLRQHPVRLHRHVTAFTPDQENYYRVRGLETNSLSPLRRAARFIYLNRYCFNGLYRTNAEGRFNVPYGAPTKIGALPTVDEFRACAQLLKSATLRSWDFGATLRYARKGDFVYLDPPYAVESRRVFREYGAKWFSKKDLERLSKHLERLDGLDATFVLSYAECREARELFGRWKHRRIKVRRNIAGFAGARRSAYELLISNRES